MIRAPDPFSFAVLFGLMVLSTPCAAQKFANTNLSAGCSVYGTPPYTFEGSRMVTINFVSSPGILRELIPEPLAPNSDNVMSVVIGEQRVVQPDTLSYREALLSIPVSL